jgi:hypothetical protein
VTHAVDGGKTNGTRARDNDAAIASGKGADAGRIGIIVSNHRGERQPRFGNPLGSNRGYNARKAKAGMEITCLEFCLACCVSGSGYNVGEGAIKILINVGRAADGFAQQTPSGIADAGPATASAAVNPEKIGPSLLHCPTIPKQYQM